MDGRKIARVIDQAALASVSWVRGGKGLSRSPGVQLERNMDSHLL